LFYRFRVFVRAVENISTKEEVVQGCRKLLREELINSYSLPNIINKPMRRRRTGHVACKLEFRYTNF
jgi:hypothetical protein